MFARVETLILITAVLIGVGNFFLIGAAPGYLLSIALLIGAGFSGIQRRIIRRRAAKNEA